MFFTKEQIQEIRTRLLQEGSKDSQFVPASLPLNNTEVLPILQSGINKQLKLSDFIESIYDTVNNYQKNDFFNVSRYLQKIHGYPEVARLNLYQALENTPTELRQGGQMITFANEGNEWETWQFNGVSSEGWNNVDTLWKKFNATKGINLTVSPVTRTVGTVQSITITVSTVDLAPATRLEIYVNGVLEETNSNEATLTYTYTAQGNEGDIEIVGKALQYGVNYEVTEYNRMNYPVHLGFGPASITNTSDLEGCWSPTELLSSGTVLCDYTIPYGTEHGYLYILLPDLASVSVPEVLMGEVTANMESPVGNITGEDITLKAYRTTDEMAVPTQQGEPDKHYQLKATIEITTQVS